MGGDGGVIAVQREFVRGTSNSAHKKRLAGWGQNYGAGTTGGDAEEGGSVVLSGREGDGAGVDPRRVRAIKVRTCALSAERLEAPIVADELGHLCNKLAMLSALSERTLPERFEHVRGLRDLVDCKLTSVADSASYHTGEDAAVTACPVTGQPLDGAKPFVVVRTTGWVLSQKAVDELGLEALQAEYGPFEADDLVRLAPDPDELDELRRRMAKRRADAKAQRRERKHHDRAAAAAKKAKTAETRPKPAAPLPEAARIAKLAAEQARGDREKNETLGAMFHETERPASGDAKKLFAATAAMRYNLN